MLVPGAAERGKDDPRLIALATSLARARFLVLVPDIESLRALTIGPEDTGRIADALRHLGGRDDVPKPDGLGLVAISYAAGPAILAALAPNLRARVGFVLTVGAYNDMEAVVTFFTTGKFRERSTVPWRYMTPNAYGKWVFLRANAGRLDSPRDHWLLAAMARRKLADLEAPLVDLAAAPGPGGAVGSRAAGQSGPRGGAGPDRGPAARLARRHGGARPEPRRAFPPRGRADLLHGRDDAIIPYTGSLALAAAVPRDRVTLCLVDNLSHVELGPGGLLDAYRLLAATYRLLALRDRD